jgi:ABC-type phosphonate transport system ATPase subunit
MYRSFHIKNFRGFRDFTLDSLERVNLIAGQNNVGKTALLEALFLHIGANDPEIGPRLNAWRGIQRYKADVEDVWGILFYDYDVNEPIELISQGDGEQRYSLRISLVEPSITVIDKPGGNGDDLVSSLPVITASRVVQLEYKDDEDRSVVSRGLVTTDGTFYSERGELKRTTMGVFRATRNQSLKEDVEVFSDLAVMGRQEELVTILKILEPRLRNLSVLVRAGAPMIHGDIGAGRLLPVSMMGEGMTRLLSIALAITKTEYRIVLIDEIENGIHYSVMSKVWGAIAQAARNSNAQIFATTHSWECIRAAHEAFSESEIYDFRLHRLDRVNGDIRAVTYDQEMLDTAIKTGLEVR